MSSACFLFTFLLFYFFTFKLYVCLQELQGSFYLQSLGRGRNYDTFAALERNLVTLVVGNLSLTLQANQNHEADQL